MRIERVVAHSRRIGPAVTYYRATTVDMFVPGIGSTPTAARVDLQSKRRNAARRRRELRSLGIIER